MNKIIKGLGIALLGCCTLTASAQEETQKEGFLKRAFRDMKESAKLQRQIDKANFQATKLETKAFYLEQKRLSKPSFPVWMVLELNSLSSLSRGQMVSHV